MKLTKTKSGFYHYRFIVRGKLYRGSTELTVLRDAQTAALEIRKQIVLGNLGILERGPAPTLKEFIEKSFLPYVRNRHKAKPNTLDYYKYGAAQLVDSNLGPVRLNEITDKEIGEYIESRGKYTAAGINQGLRTLRRALSLAYEWHQIDRKQTIKLCAGERQRTRILTPEEEKAYLDNCTEPWKTMATLMLEIGLRPGEIFKLRVEDFSRVDSTLKITSGKSAAAQRELPLTDAAYKAISLWCQSSGSRKTGWMFPSPTKKGSHLHQKNAFDWHHSALESSNLKTFEPYCLRHTALTRIAEYCRNPFAVAAIAGHSSIAITQRYVHPQKAEIWKAFEEKTGLKIGHAARRENLKVAGSKSDE